MKDEYLKQAMTALYIQSKQENTDMKKIIAEAVSLGMQYQQHKIKEGIDIVFNEINK